MCLILHELTHEIKWRVELENSWAVDIKGGIFVWLYDTRLTKCYKVKEIANIVCYISLPIWTKLTRRDRICPSEFAQIALTLKSIGQPVSGRQLKERQSERERERRSQDNKYKATSGPYCGLIKAYINISDIVWCLPSSSIEKHSLFVVVVQTKTGFT